MFQITATTIPHITDHTIACHIAVKACMPESTYSPNYWWLLVSIEFLDIFCVFLINIFPVFI